MKVFWLLFFCFAWLLPHAQFNDSITHHMRYAASGNINRTNTSTAYLLTNDARFRIKNKKSSLNTAASWVYGVQGANLTNNDFVATMDFNRFLSRHDFYYWGLANYTSSFSLKINNQVQAGLGLAYNFIDTTDAWLNLSNGILFEKNNLRTGNAARDNYQTLRNSLRLSYRFVVGNLLIFSGTNFLQNSLSERGDYILRTNNSLNFKVNKWISLGTTLSFNQLRRTGAENLLFTYGLTAEKYF